MKIGYACTLANPIYGRMKTCRMKDVNDERLQELIAQNLGVLKQMINYNVRNKIRLFRISSDLIPFGSSEVNRIKWWELFREQFKEIGEIAKKNHIRLSMHPGQYTVLNSPDEQVVERAVADLFYHCQVLDAMELDSSNKIILHIGGVYQNREQALQRFEENFLKLPKQVIRRLVIENDDRSYSAKEVLDIARRLHIPMVFDVFHHEVLPSKVEWTLTKWIDQVKETWGSEDGTMKMHYSQQASNKKPGAHSQTIDILKFRDFYQNVQNREIDLMLEVKDKNVSALKCMLVTIQMNNISLAEAEWGRYKYWLLEHSHVHYLKAREIIRQKEEFYTLNLFRIIQEGLALRPTIGSQINAGMHVWGYFKDCANAKEKAQYQKYIDRIQEGQQSAEAMKKFLWKMTIKYQQQFLLESYYFIINGEE